MKKTRKIQILVDEDTYQTLERMMYWQYGEGYTKARSMSSYMREHVERIIESTPEWHKRSLRNIKR